MAGNRPDQLVINNPETLNVRPLRIASYLNRNDADRFKNSIPSPVAGYGRLDDSEGHWDTIAAIAGSARNLFEMRDTKLQANEARYLIPLKIDPANKRTFDSFDLVLDAQSLAESAVDGKKYHEADKVKQSTLANSNVNIDSIRVGIPLQDLFAHDYDKQGILGGISNINYRLGFSQSPDGSLTFEVKSLIGKDNWQKVDVIYQDGEALFMINNDTDHPKYLGVRAIGKKDSQNTVGYYLQTAIYDDSNFPGATNDLQRNSLNSGDTQPYRLPGVDRDPDATVEYKRTKVLEPEVGYEDANEQLVNYLSIPRNKRLQIGRGDKSDPNNNYINIDKSNEKSGLSRKHATISVEADGRTFYLDEGATYPNSINDQLIEKFTTREIPDKAILQFVQHEGAPRYQFYVVQTPEGAHFFKLSGNKKEWPQIIVSIQRKVRLDDDKLAEIRADLEQKANS